MASRAPSHQGVSWLALLLLALQACKNPEGVAPINLIQIRVLHLTLYAFASTSCQGHGEGRLTESLAPWHLLHAKLHP